MPSHPTPTSRRLPDQLRQGEIWLEYFCIASLFFAALILFLVNLGNLPLLDPNEGIVAQVAQEIYQGMGTSLNSIFPTLWGRPYWEQPPLVHNLIAIAYKIAGVNEFATRLPGALLASISVILIYQIGREIFIARLPALFSALVYLTCLPIVRLGRLAMLDGPLLCFELLAVWGILRSRRDLRWSLVAGIGFGLMSLTKGIVSLQILVIVLVFLFWDTPRLLTSIYLWTGLALGVAPGVAWYVCQWFHYPELKTAIDFVNLIFGQISLTKSELKQLQPIGYYLIVGLQYVIPWLIVILAGLKSASRNLQWSWGKLLTVWTGVYLVLSFLLINQNYWSFIPLYPALALAAGKKLDLIRNLPSYIVYPRTWSYGFALMAVLAAFAGLHWGIRDYVDFYLPFICGSLAITFAATAIVLTQQEQQFIPLLFWGLFISILILVISPHWLWEQKITEPIKPIAEMLKKHTPPQTIVYTSMLEPRPSLNFYSDRQIIPQNPAQLKQYWQQNSTAYLLLKPDIIKRLNLPQEAVIKDDEFKSLTWKLVTKLP
ncbi:glycosyltransferase family 39 protein [Pleurocapsa sp. PCC 7319]|uniref:ArnT family glycosyltransferase n=1 Tax=Pleurocapsa sp. PCC 7319 TaxID=118161 RepID=UPI00038254B2|nr:glycosyltransferase family 39 protein [Pleurocapsa sp. PCC 7319]